MDRGWAKSYLAREWNRQENFAINRWPWQPHLTFGRIERPSPPSVALNNRSGRWCIRLPWQRGTTLLQNSLHIATNKTTIDHLRHQQIFHHGGRHTKVACMRLLFVAPSNCHIYLHNGCQYLQKGINHDTVKQEHNLIRLLVCLQHLFQFQINSVGLIYKLLPEPLRVACVPTYFANGLLCFILELKILVALMMNHGKGALDRFSYRDER